MPIPLIQPLVEEKNKISQEQPWLVCLKMTNVAGDVTIRLVRNTENITFKGEEYIAFPFELDNIPEVSKGTLPSLSIKVSNVDRQIQRYVEQDATFGSNWTVTISLVHVSELTGNAPEGQVAEIEQTWVSLDVKATNEFLVINLGIKNPMNTQFPRQKYTGGFCQRTFDDGLGCPYSSEGIPGFTTCNKTREACSERFSSKRKNQDGALIGLPFLAFPGMEVRAIHVT